MGVVPPPLTRFVLQSGMAVMLPVLGLTALLYVLIFIYLNGRQTVGWRRGFWSDLGDSLTVLLPWRWKRLQRDFSTLLAILLDAGIPEAEAVKLAAQGTANQVFIQRARQVIEDLRGGVKLTQAVQRLDGTGEFRWRLTNAVAGQNGFLAALAGWHEALEAKAYQLEQTAAHLVTTAFVLITGVLVGVTVTGIFGLLIAIINEGVLW
jgi:type II secretory pathway component PulF